MRWKTFDSLMNPYRAKGYQRLDIGIVPVNPKEIIGISLDYSHIVNGDKFKTLKSSVQKNGWNDTMPDDLYLMYLPIKKYTVAEGGNHRTVLSDQLNIPCIQANVCILIPNNKISKNVFSILKTIDNHDYPKAQKEYTQIVRDLNEAMFHTRIKEDIERLDEMSSSYTKFEELINLKNALFVYEARRLNLFPPSL